MKGRPRADFIIALLAVLASFAIYNVNLRPINSGDTFPSSYLPFDLLRYHTLYFNPMADLVKQGHTTDCYWVTPGKNRRLVSLYPVVTPVAITPLYLPMALDLARRGWPEDRLQSDVRIMEKLCASLIAALSAGVMCLALLRRVDARTAVLLTAAYAFGTNTWVISSQALWQHGMGELLLAASLLLATGPMTARRAFALGAVCALAPCNRPPDALLAAAPALWALWTHRRFAPWLVAGALLGAAPEVLYNVIATGHLVGAYALEGDASFFSHNPATGLAGLLFSPTHGLFVFTPFLLFLPFALRRAFGEPGTGRLAVFISAAMGAQLLVYSLANWAGGASWGPRWL
ncbi:MAG TPA: hypothetical protein VG710_12820, partial [Opitutus sp.]|nr:hypothetical protein [Opitutus sp.]